MHSETRELFLPDLQDDYHVMLPEVNKPFELDV
jgi:hypothetical protein